MALNPLKVFMFVVGGTLAAAATAFFSGAMDSESLLAEATKAVGASASNEPGNAAASGTATAEGRQGKPEAQASRGGESEAAADSPAADLPAAAATPAAPAGETGAATDGQSAAAVPGADGIPTFDVVRVEPDGSMVVAGRAAPQASVNMVASGKVLGSAVAGTEGEFAVVLEKPLPPGEYQIQLSGTTADGETETSTQTALISVPADANGQVLAMVEEPGAPSRLLSVPESASGAETTGRASSAPAAPAPAQGGEAATQPRAQGGDKAAVDLRTAAPAEAAPPQGGSAPATDPASGPASDNPAGGASVSVQAVEIEGRRIFVAGQAPAGSTVRVYADGILLGDAKASPSGQFLVETVRDLAVGTYTVRADVLNARGAVTARAAVPFERDAGEAVAAVAPELQRQADAEASATAGDAVRGATGTEAADPGGASATVGSGASEPGSVPSQANGTPVSPAAEEPPAGAEPLKTFPDAAAPEQADGQARRTGQAAADPALAPAAGGTPALDAGSTGAAAGSTVTEQPPAVERAGSGQDTAAASNAASGSEAAEAASLGYAEEAARPAGVAAVEDAAGSPAAGPVTALAPKLQNVDAAVIIRRGDSLWRISRRVYGLGTRYSTIYLANSDQIRDPDLIMPGQVFAVPSKSQQGEAADLGAIETQVTTMPQTPAQAPATSTE